MAKSTSRRKQNRLRDLFFIRRFPKRQVPEDWERPESDKEYAQLLESEDFYKKSAACWFIGKRHFDLGDKPKAREYFSMVAGDAALSKFATMCWEYMGQE